MKAMEEAEGRETYVRYFPAEWWSHKDWISQLFQRALVSFVLSEREEAAKDTDRPIPYLSLIQAVDSLGVLQMLDGNFTMADSHMREAINLLNHMNATGTPIHPEIPTALFYRYGQLLDLMHDYNGAARAFKTSLIARTSLYKDQHYAGFLQGNTEVVKLYLKGKSMEDAKRTQFENVNVAERLFGRETAEFGVAAALLGQICIHMADYSQGDKWYGLGVDALRKSRGPASHEALEVTIEAIGLFMDVGECRFAERWIANALAVASHLTQRVNQVAPQNLLVELLHKQLLCNEHMGKKAEAKRTKRLLDEARGELALLESQFAWEKRLASMGRDHQASAKKSDHNDEL
eukprot:scaffold5807_cov412-Prasinococcus_capsulatus_cf.AAC.3